MGITVYFSKLYLSILFVFASFLSSDSVYKDAPYTEII